MDEQNEEAFYTIYEFADKLKVHHNTIRRAIKSGRISAFRVGLGKKTSYRIAHSEINRIALFDLEEMIEKIIKERMECQKSPSQINNTNS